MAAHQSKMWQKDGVFLEQPFIAILILECILHFAGGIRGFSVRILHLVSGIQGFKRHIQGFELTILKFTFSKQFRRAEKGAIIDNLYLIVADFDCSGRFPESKTLAAFSVQAQNLLLIF